MRLTHVITSLATGGAQNLVVDLSIEAARAGHLVRIVTFSPAAGLPLERAVQNGLEVVTLGASARDPRAICRLARVVKDSDIVHVHLFPALYYAALAALGKPLVYTEHSTHNRRRESRWLRVFERAAYKHYDKVVAISAGAGEALQNYFSKIRLDVVVEVIPNGIGRNYFDEPREVLPHDRPLKLIAVGTLDSRKNFKDAVASVKGVTGLSLSIVGDGPLAAKLRQQIADLHLEERVSLEGARGDVQRRLDTHHVLLSTSRFEGFGLVAAEAMARGCVVVAPDIAGLNGVVVDGETGLLYPPSPDPSEAIARCLRLLRDDAATYGRLATNALRQSKRFGIERTSLAYLDVYDRILTPGTR